MGSDTFEKKDIREMKINVPAISFNSIKLTNGKKYEYPGTAPYIEEEQENTVVVKILTTYKQLNIINSDHGRRRQSSIALPSKCPPK